MPTQSITSVQSMSCKDTRGMVCDYDYYTKHNTSQLFRLSVCEDYMY